MNSIHFTGRLVKDAELKGAVALFTIAVPRKFKKEGQPDADFINMKAFSKTGENLVKYTNKGTLISVDGRVQTNSYDDKEGNKKYSTDLIAENIEYLTKSGNSNNSEGNEGITPAEDGDMPF